MPGAVHRTVSVSASSTSLLSRRCTDAFGSGGRHFNPSSLERERRVLDAQLRELLAVRASRRASSPRSASVAHRASAAGAPPVPARTRFAGSAFARRFARESASLRCTACSSSASTRSLAPASARTSAIARGSSRTRMRDVRDRGPRAMRATRGTPLLPTTPCGSRGAALRGPLSEPPPSSAPRRWPRDSSALPTTRRGGRSAGREPGAERPRLGEHREGPLLARAREPGNA